MPGQHSNRNVSGNPWARKWATVALAVACSSGALTEAFAQSGPLRFGRKPYPGASAAKPASGFALTIQKLMDQARQEADAGSIDAAIKTAQRAKKIAEAAAPTLGASPDCSPAVVDQFYRDLLAMRPTSLSPSGRSVFDRDDDAEGEVNYAVEALRPVAESKVIKASAVIEKEGQGTPGVERWQPQGSNRAAAPVPVVARIIAAPKAEAVLDEVDFPAESPASIVIGPTAPAVKSSVVLKRAHIPDAPIASDLGLSSSMMIVGGNRSDHAADVSNHELPLDQPLQITTDEADPDWMRSDVFLAETSRTTFATAETTEEANQPVSDHAEHFDVKARAVPALRVETPLNPTVPAHDSSAFVEMTVLPSSPQWETPHFSSAENEEERGAQHLGAMAGWTSSGAVVRKHRIARSVSLVADGWQTADSETALVTRAGGSVADSSATASADAVATTAYRSSSSDVSDVLPFANPSARQMAPPPPDFDDDVALQSPSVWKRQGVATVPRIETSAKTASPLWQQFSAWAQRCGWTGTSAVLGLCAAGLALAALVITLTPRKRRSV